MQHLINKILDRLNIDGNLVLKKKIRGLPGITAHALVEALVLNDTLESAASYLSYTINPVKQCIRELLLPHFPERNKVFGSGGGVCSWRIELLSCIRHKLCHSCSTIKEYTSFINDVSKPDGLGSRCKVCEIINTKAKKFYVAERTPEWSDLDAIAIIYNNCPKGFHVDHILPLRGKLVSGLHVPENLQYLSASCNLQKGNRIDLEDYNNTGL